MVHIVSKRLRSCSYHPQAQGMIERFHRQLKASLMGHGYPENWSENLPLILLGIRTSYKEDLQCSSVEPAYGSSIRIPGEFILPSSTPSDYHTFLARHRQCADSWKPSLPRQTRHAISI